eukprot:CAMPEP_0182423528 /NCGR_PEP_ID=MMETSP1167-20130531/9564_1 /TAXON_ID=2988 /ORGANISM="Mallomonas Sp, Strain CCMP3275" /LENGTH=289 /DNA_ID=CAMNT_0024602599 /DNA_START=88 /DNA_END=957 /DNA_ORIENTATION=+
MPNTFRLNTFRSLSDSNQHFVKAYYIARALDVEKIRTKLFKDCAFTKDSKSRSVVLDKQKGQYISLFNYGSVVLFNLSDKTCEDHLSDIRKAGGLPNILEDLYTEEYVVVVKTSLESASVIRDDSLDVRDLNTHNLSMVSTVMAQTVALDYYAQRVDRIIENFMVLNKKVEEKGNFNSMDGIQLNKLIASNSSIMATVLSKLGIFEGSDSAWTSRDNSKTWEGLRKEFEVEQRYKDLSLKLDIVHNNSRFFLEMIQHQHSNKLEWIIIVLIGVEIVIGVASLSMGIIHI